MMNNYYWVYILECENGSFYTGYTNNLTKRFQSHMKGSRSCKYTRSFKPIRIAQSWKIEGRALAMKMERFVKTLTHQEKENLILHPHFLSSKFNK